MDIVDRNLRRGFDMKKLSGFTLAEVLITLTIIGVVASLTLPSLNSNTGASRNRTALKKTLTVLNNAVLMNETRHSWNFSGISIDSSNTNCQNTNANEDFSICALLNDALIGETSADDYFIDVGFGSPAYFQKYQLADGAIVGLNRHVLNCTEEKKRNAFNSNFNNVCYGFIDVNGNRGPNQLIQCQTGTTKFIPNELDADYNQCEVNSNTNADIFPIVFYNSTVELASNAAKVYFNQ